MCSLRARREVRGWRATTTHSNVVPMMRIDNDAVFGFIERFTSKGQNTGTIDTFSNGGCCYWFAAVLMIRFWEYSPTIMYDEVANHFATQIGGRVFDITGDVTDVYDWEPWDDVCERDELLTYRIMRDCIEF